MLHRASRANAIFSGGTTTVTTVNWSASARGLDGGHRLAPLHLQRLGDAREALTQSGGRAEWHWHADGDGSVDIVWRDAERFWDDDCAGRGGVQLDGLRAGWRSDAATGRHQHGERDAVQINLNGANPNTGVSDAGSGTLTIGNGATFNDQTTSSGLTIIRHSPRRQRHRRDGGGEQPRHIHQERQRGDLDDQHAFNNSGTVNVTERHAEPVAAVVRMSARATRAPAPSSLAAERGRWMLHRASRATRLFSGGDDDDGQWRRLARAR